MVERIVDCRYFKECAGKSVTKCLKCKNNKVRNMEVDYFEEAVDNPIPEVSPVVTYTGPAEQTPGYKCPVCSEYTSPYRIKDNRCCECGYKMRLG